MIYSKNEKDVLKELKTSVKGLSNLEVEKRSKLGKNVIPKEKEKNPFQIFFSQIIDPIVIVLLITTVFSLIIGEYIDAIFIIIVILMDAILGTFQEWQALRNASALQDLIKTKTTVLRSGELLEISAEDLVVGDVVLIESGDKISADIRLLEANNLNIDESVLTGESVASLKNTKVLKDNVPLAERTNMAYAGTIVVSGRGKGVVAAIGLNTEVGKIATDVMQNDEAKSPLVIRMEKFTKQISILIAAISLVIVSVLYFKGMAAKEIFFTVVALSVSAIPEGLPMVLTITLSIATNKMAKKNVIVRKLNSVESLGSCTVIASDKTGTLTINEQTAKIVLLTDGSRYKITGSGYNGEGKIEEDNVESRYKNSKMNLEKLGKLGALNNEAVLEKNSDDWYSHGDSIDIAFLALAYKLKISHKIKERINITSIIPYESQNKYSAVFYEENNEAMVTAKGSVETILNFCSKDLEDKKLNKEKILELHDEYAKQGYRIIAVANGKTKENKLENLTLVGLVCFIDPIRIEAKEAINKCHNAGMKIIMITGDNHLTAANIAKELNLISDDNEVTTGTEIDKFLEKDEKEFDEFIKSKNVYARVTPNQKLKIVESFKRQGEFIAVTGDGVNDAPALKSANIGIAMGTSSDVAKEASTMIITDDNFMSIVHGIEEGRYAYSNIRKVIYMLLSCGLAEILFILLSIIFDLPIPLIAVQLLWLNLVTDGIQDVALAMEKGDPNEMKKKPRNPKENIFDKLLLEETLLSGLVIGISVFVFWAILIHNNMEIAHARTYILIIMVFMQNVHVLNCRNEYQSIFKQKFKDNPFVIIAIFATILLQIFITESDILDAVLQTCPLEITKVLFALLFTLPLVIIMEIFKHFKRKKLNK